MSVPVEPHRDPEWTRLATLGWESQLTKVQAVLAGSAPDTSGPTTVT